MSSSDLSSSLSEYPSFTSSTESSEEKFESLSPDVLPLLLTSLKDSLFQDRFRSENVENVRYLLTVIRYIHQNPVKAGIVKEVEQWRWSSSVGYYGYPTYFKNLSDVAPILRMFSDDLDVARKRFKEFNEQSNQDECLNDRNSRRLTDDEGKEEIKKLLGEIEIPHVKSLPKLERNVLLRNIKTIDGISNRQAARILGVSPSLINKA